MKAELSQIRVGREGDPDGGREAQHGHHQAVGPEWGYEHHKSDEIRAVPIATMNGRRSSTEV